jgi:HD superfamily phosphohydrolase YqeK
MEPGRNKASNLYEVRKLAFSDLDKALVRILQDTLVYLSHKGEEIDPGTQETLNYYMSNQ